MTAIRRITSILALLSASAVLGGCSGRNKPPDGYGVVQEHVVFAPRNIPPIRSTLDFTIIEIDGAPVKRETPPLFVDMQPGALVSAGTHRFSAMVAPHARPPGYQPHEITFSAHVEAGRIYDLVDDKDGNPILIEEHAGPQ
jgi:hypothetical protein